MRNPFEKPHTAEAYKAAEKEEEATARSAHTGHLSSDQRTFDNQNFREQLHQEALKKLQRLRERGREDAEDLAAQHEKLAAKAREAAEALFEFEKTQLGMHAVGLE